MSSSTHAGGERERGNYDHLAPLFDEMRALGNGDPRRERVRRALITEHLQVARNIANKFRNRGESVDDLTQVASLGLVKAVDRFDPRRGSDFMSFAVPTIIGEVRRHFRDTTWVVRVPRQLKELHTKIDTASTELTQRHGRAPTPSEVAAYLGIPTPEVIEGLQVVSARRSSSLDEAPHDGGSDATGTTIADTLGAYDRHLAGIDNQQALRPLLAALSETERTVLALRFVHNMTQSQIAERIGVSQMQVSRMLSRTMTRLRDGLVS